MQRVTSLRYCAQASASAASYWLRRAVDDGGRRDEFVLQGVPAAGVVSAMYHCLVRIAAYK